MSLSIWVLTFNRPEALNRLITHFGTQGYHVNIFSNHPRVQLLRENRQYINEVVVNTLNSEESNSWCARSWNSILLRAFNTDDEVICIQDDTDIGPNFVKWFEEVSRQYDFLWGPAGDQFFYIRKKVFQKVGWWDERYIGCYAADADFLKRVCIAYDKSKLSIEDSHNWGFRHNASGISENVITTYQSKTIDPDYDNQHWQFERLNGQSTKTTETNPTILHAQKLFKEKWGIILDNGRPLVENLDKVGYDIDWYPWFSKKHNIDIDNGST